jgi:hypothetical protein
MLRRHLMLRGGLCLLRLPVPENPYEVVLTSRVFEKFAALFDKNLLLLCAAALISEFAESYMVTPAG